MATIVLVHGIGHEQTSADTLEDEWIPDLAGGVRLAGYPELADQIRAERLGQNNTYGVRMAYYGHLFRTPGEMGAGAAEAPTTDLTNALAEEWFERALESPDDRTRQQATMIQNRLSGEGEQQGVRAGMRPLVNSLADLRWFSRVGQHLIARFLVRSLRQVDIYFSDNEIRRSAIESVKKLTDDRTRIIIAHSLGSVVAYEACHEIDRPIPLLVTMGSPLGFKGAVKNMVKPAPSFPLKVARWFNVAGRDDLVAAEPDLAPLFSGGMPGDAIFNGLNIVDTGSKPHKADYYLTKITVGKPIGEALLQI